MVSTPIGNPSDISARALQILGSADLVVCEELRHGSALLSRHHIERPLVELNEHTEPTAGEDLVRQLEQGAALALISDHGTPLLADPGRILVEQAIAAGVRVTAVPGPSALLAALVVSGLPWSRFRYIGLLPRKTEARRAALVPLAQERDTWVVLEAPYRLRPLLADLLAALGPERRAVIACDLTLPGEQVLRGTLAELDAILREHRFRGEFVVVIQGASSRPHQKAARGRSVVNRIEK